MQSFFYLFFIKNKLNEIFLIIKQITCILLFITGAARQETCAFIYIKIIKITHTTWERKKHEKTIIKNNVTS